MCLHPFWKIFVMQVNRNINRISSRLPVVITVRNKITFDLLKSYAKSAKIRIGDWKSSKISPTPYQKPLKFSLNCIRLTHFRNRYIPFSKRFLYRELSSDAEVVPPAFKGSFENIAMLIDEKVADQYRVLSEESMVWFYAFISLFALFDFNLLAFDFYFPHAATFSTFDEQQS